MPIEVKFESDDPRELLQEIRDFIEATTEGLGSRIVAGEVGELMRRNGGLPDPSPVTSSPAEGGANLASGPPDPTDGDDMQYAGGDCGDAGTPDLPGIGGDGHVDGVGHVDADGGEPVTDADIDANAAAQVERDANGWPFDPRIHSVNRTTKAGVRNADNTWRGKRSLKPDVLAAVHAELKAAGYGTPPVAAPPVSKTPDVPDTPSSPLVGADTGATIALATQLVESVSDEAGLRAIGDDMRAVIAPFGMTSINDLIGNPDAAPAVHAGLLEVKAKWMPETTGMPHDQA